MSWADDAELMDYMRKYHTREPTNSELKDALAGNSGWVERASTPAFKRTLMDAEAKAALAPVLRSSRPSRFRLLDVACTKNHRLALVYRTASGPVVTGRGPITVVENQVVGGDSVPGPDGYAIDLPWETVVQRQTRGNRQAELCFFLEARKPGYYAEFQCRCRTALIERGWLEERIAEGRKRVVFTDWTDVPSGVLK